MSYGKYAIDWEERVNMDRLKRERVEKAKAEINRDGLGAMILYDYSNIRYVTGHMIPFWARFRTFWFAIQPRNGLPTLFVCGSHTKRVKNEWATWLEGRVKPAPVIDFIKMGGESAEGYFKVIKETLAEYGVQNEPIGIDRPLGYDEDFKKAGIKLVPAKNTMVRARTVKTPDEIALYRIASECGEVAFADIQDAIRPGVRETDLQAVGARSFWREGCDGVNSFNVLSGQNTNPNTRMCSDRALRPGDLVFIDLAGVGYQGYQLCYYRTFCCGEPNARQKEMYQECYDMIYKVVKMVKPGVSTADLALAFPSYDYFRNEIPDPPESEWEALEIAVGHGIGLSLHDEQPLIHRSVSLAKPMKLQAGMVIALETWAGRLNPNEGCRIEEMLVVTEDGYEMLSKYPVKEISAGWR